MPALLLLLLPLLPLIYLIIKALTDPLLSIPGPFLARFTRLWYLWQIYKGGFERENLRLHRRYGSVVRIAPGEFSLDVDVDVDGGRGVYGGKGEFLKAPWYWAANPPDPAKASLFSDLDPVRHGIQKRKFAKAYSMSSLVSLEGFVDHCSEVLVERLSSFAENSPSASPSQDQNENESTEEGEGKGQMIQLQDWLHYYALDVIGEITFGRPFGYLERGKDNGAIQAIWAKLTYAAFVGVYPWLHAWLFPLFVKMGGGGHGFLMNFTLDSIARRKKELASVAEKGSNGENRGERGDMLSKFLTMQKEQQEEQKEPDKGGEGTTSKMTDLDIILICQTNIGAGSDTTAITLSAIFYNLLRHPLTLARLRAEIDSAYATGDLSDPITFKQTQGLKYLQAVIKEGLRVFPATGLGMQRIVPKEGARLAGRWFRGGETVGINAWVAHANKGVFGEDAESWRPERWLEIEEEGRGAEVERYFFSFGMGSRSCFGKNISLLEMSKLVPLLVRKFDFELDERLQGEGKEWKTLNRWFVKQLDFGVRIKLRETSELAS
ncbi:hypothetical protein EG329_010668 [Mollisiaceae sp. DMI_Dod_QoI]|nr:hypothetical protein EG329_010668 [Helotiales sp. DMI_Dod_QoI]